MAGKLEIIAEPGTKTIETRRLVDAPRELVYEAFTKSEHLKRWVGPRHLTLEIVENDVRVGGRYRFIHRTPDGQEFGFRGEYREIVPPERLSRTFIFELMPQHEAYETATFTPQGRKTLITTLTVHQSVEARDGHLANGAMEQGMVDGYARLDDLLAEMAPSR